MAVLILRYAFDVLGVSSVQLNVFDTNDRAKKCYLNAGFIEDNVVEGAFAYKDEAWGRCHMVITKRYNSEWGSSFLENLSRE